MRFKVSTAGVLVTGALLFAVPAAASASTSNASPTSNNIPSATSSQFAQVADGQTMAQVDQEMGSAGAVEYNEPTVTVVRWNDSSLGVLGNVAEFSVNFSGSATSQPGIVTGKTALGLGI